MTTLIKKLLLTFALFNVFTLNKQKPKYIQNFTAEGKTMGIVELQFTIAVILRQRWEPLNGHMSTLI